MEGLNPFECVLGHKTKMCPSIEVTPKVVVTSTFKTYLQLKKQLAYLKQHLQKFRDKNLELLNNDDITIVLIQVN